MELKRNKKQTVFISGIFNVLHPGHVRLFKFASELADKVIVGLRADVNQDASVPFEERKQALNCVSLISKVIEVRDLKQELLTLKPDIILKGSEFKNRENEEEALLDNWGGELVFSSGESQIDSNNYVHRNGFTKEIYIPSTYRNYAKRHNIDKDKIIDALEAVGNLRVAVIGDSILDEYVSCDPVGLSREDPTIVVTPTDKKLFIGGAAIVAMHTRAYGANVDFYTVAGLDEGADFLGTTLESHGINAHIYSDKSRPTTVKRRFRAQNKTLLRVNDFRSHSIERKIQRKMLADFSSAVKDYDLVIFSDFNYGALCKEVVDKLQACCLKHGVSMIADSQTSSQRGDLAKFNNLLLTTPTEIEARLAVDNHDNDVGLAIVIEQVANSLSSQYVVITLGAEGALLLDNTGPKTAKVDSLPALNKNPVDVSGAGDLLMVSSSLLLKRGLDLWHATLVGMIASAIHISEVGNKPIAIDKIKEYLQEL